MVAGQQLITSGRHDMCLLLMNDAAADFNQAESGTGSRIELGLPDTAGSLAFSVKWRSEHEGSKPLKVKRRLAWK